MRALDVLIEAFERQDIEPWAREGITSRLSSTFPPEGVAWCVAFMGRTAVSTPVGSMQTITYTDIRADVPKIACPTLAITTEGSGLATVDETRAWQPPIPDAGLLVLPGDADHVTASHAAQCVQATLAFIEGRDPDDGR
jgi:3-oxoadipate enol-lactonase